MIENTGDSACAAREIFVAAHSYPVAFAAFEGSFPETKERLFALPFRWQPYASGTGYLSRLYATRPSVSM